MRILTLFQRLVLPFCLALFSISAAQAMPDGIEMPDSVAVEPSVTVTADTIAKPKGLFNKIMAYFDDSNKPKEPKKFDFSIIGGPHYSSDAVGIGLIAAGLYRTDSADTISPPSSVSIFADATTDKHFNIGVEGYHLFKGDRSRLSYIAVFQSLDTKFWGIGYDEGVCDDNESDYDYLRMKIDTRYLIRFGKHVYIGPKFNFDYIHGRDFEKPELWHGQGRILTTFGPVSASRTTLATISTTPTLARISL